MARAKEKGRNKGKAEPATTARNKARRAAKHILHLEKAALRRLARETK